MKKRQHVPNVSESSHIEQGNSVGLYNPFNTKHDGPIGEGVQFC